MLSNAIKVCFFSAVSALAPADGPALHQGGPVGGLSSHQRAALHAGVHRENPATRSANPVTGELQLIAIKNGIAASSTIAKIELQLKMVLLPLNCN